jgi:hypothetical protein
MSLRHKLIEEIQAVVLTTLYFAICFGVLVLLKRLYLAEYQIEFRGLSLMLVGALIVAKVVVVMEHVSLGQWVRAHPALLEAMLRTLLYSIGVFAALMLEKGFEARHEHGGVISGTVWVFQHRDVHHVWADTFGVGCALLVFNALSVLQRQLGKGQLRRLFLSHRPKIV